MDDIIQEALDKGVKLHAAGQLDLAEQLCLAPNFSATNFGFL